MENLIDLVNKQIFNLNWDARPTCYEYTNEVETRKEPDSNIGIIIDNGSYECRAGWSNFDEPNLRFRSIVAKPKIQTNNNESLFLIGNEMLAMDQGKLHKKSPFERNYVAHFGTQEHILDYVFKNLNINNDVVNHPVLIIEPLANLNWSRKNLSELMFELYNAPSLCYGVDMLFSLGYNTKNKSIDSENCLIISSSYQTTHIVPVLNGRVHLDKTRRIGVGAFHGNELLTKSMNLRYPEVKSKFTSELLQDIQEKYTMCAVDYKRQLHILQSMYEYDAEKLREEEKKRMFGSLEMYEKANYEEIIQKKIYEGKYKHLKKYKNIIEYENENYIEENKYDLDIIRDIIFFELPTVSHEVVLTEEEQRRKGEIRKEQSRRLREMMQKKREENMKNLEKELIELEKISALKSGDQYQYEEALLNKGFTSNEELQKRINKIFMKINFNKENKEEEEETRFDEEKRWPLLTITDEDLTEDQIKMKKIHKMQRQAYINRLEKREKQKKEKERVEELRQKDPESYLVNLYRRKKEVMERLEKYKQARKDISSRTSKVNRGRMMLLAEMGKEGKKGENIADDFGAKDEDWEVYRGISRHSLSEDEEEDTQILQEIEAQIIENDPNYFKFSDNINDKLMFSSNHLCLGVDQFRGAELLFQPYIIGIDQAGIIEIILAVFKTMSFNEQKLLAGNIFLTGGFCKTKYLKERIYKDLRANLPCEININITIADDPELDAWKGARDFNNLEENKKSFISRSEYYECGFDYFKEHKFSNNALSTRGGSCFNYEVSGKKQKTM